jgi:hypothetical protein
MEWANISATHAESTLESTLINGISEAKNTLRKGIFFTGL